MRGYGSMYLIQPVGLKGFHITLVLDKEINSLKSEIYSTKQSFPRGFKRFIASLFQFGVLPFP